MRKVLPGFLNGFTWNEILKNVQCLVFSRFSPGTKPLKMSKALLLFSRVSPGMESVEMSEGLPVFS